MDNIINTFDQVQIKTTKNISYLSNENASDPRGIWSVCNVIGKEALIIKNDIVLRIPIEDIVVVQRYDISKITQIFDTILKKENNGQE